MNKSTMAGLAGIILLAVLILNSPFKSQEGDFSKILRVWGNQQSQQSEQITNDLLKDAEGNLVGEHEVDGSNWSIPNIIRHILGVD